jgi:hypothetical protein
MSHLKSFLSKSLENSSFFFFLNKESIQSKSFFTAYNLENTTIHLPIYSRFLASLIVLGSSR